MADLSIPICLRGIPTGENDPRLNGITVQPWEPEELRAYVVQFIHSLLAHERRELQVTYGLALEDYVPKFAYIEMMDEETVVALDAHPLVNAVFPYKVRVPPEPDAPPGPIFEEQPPAPDRLLWIGLSPQTSPEEVARELREAGASEVRIFDDRLIGGVARIQILMAPGGVENIAGIDGIRWIEPVPVTSPDNETIDDILDGGIAGATPILDAGLRGKDQIVSIIDSGSFDTEHCWFLDLMPNNAVKQAGPSHRKLVGVRDDSMTGLHAHTSFVAGIIAGDDIASPGILSLRGIASDARLTFGNRKDTLGSQALHSLYEYLVRAAVDNAYIHNTSWHSSHEQFGFQYSQDAVDVDKFVWESEDCLVVGSSGNRNPPEPLGPPGSAKNSLCVSAAFVHPVTGDGCVADGAVVAPDADGRRTTEDGRRKPDLIAPGCDIRSAVLPNTTVTPPDRCVKEDHQHSGIPNPGDAACDPDNHACASSFAAPVVAAAAAIVRQYFVEGWYPTGKKVKGHRRAPTAALLKATLLNATEKLGAGAEYPTDDAGWGLLRLNRILRLPDGTRRIRVWDIRNAIGVFTGEARQHRVLIDEAGKLLKVTLVWSDPPGQKVATDPVVNNLDLIVTSPNGKQIYLGNWFKNGESDCGNAARPAKPDDRNNVEMVQVRNAPRGLWTITVKAAEVNVGNTGQGYALVVRGGFG